MTCVLGLPVLPGVVGPLDEAFVDVVDSLPLAQQLEHSQSVLLTLHKTPLRVGLNVATLELLVPETKAVSQNGLHLVSLDGVVAAYMVELICDNLGARNLLVL